MTFNHKNNSKDIELCILRADYVANLSQCSPTPDLNNFVVDDSSQFSPLKINPIENGAGIDAFSSVNKDKAIAADINLDFDGSKPDSDFTDILIQANVNPYVITTFKAYTFSNTISNNALNTYILSPIPTITVPIPTGTKIFFRFSSNITNNTSFKVVSDNNNNSNTKTYVPITNKDSSRKNYVLEFNGSDWIDIGQDNVYFKKNLPHKYFRRYSFVLERGYKYHIEFYWAGTQITNQNTELLSDSSLDDLIGESKRLGIKMFSSNFSHYDIGLAGKSLNRTNSNRILSQNSSKKYYNLIENAYTDTTIYIDYNVSNLLDYQLNPFPLQLARKAYQNTNIIKEPISSNNDYGIQDILSFKKYSTINNLNKECRLMIWRVKI